MDKEFKVSGKENVLGRLRNIFAKMKKRLGKQGEAQPGKTKYIKCKGEFVKLSTYIKEHDKVTKADKDGKIVKINKKISVINNISKIKDKKIRNLLLKTFKKNAKIYFISDNKKWHGKGGMPFCKGDDSERFCRDSDRGVIRKLFNSSESDRGRGRGREREYDRGREYDRVRVPDLGRSRDSRSGSERDRISYWQEPIDKISIQLSFDKENLVRVMEQINNLYYRVQIIGDSKSFVIRPCIKYTENDKIIINFYFSIEGDERWAMGDHRKWVELPIHVTLFFSVTKEGNEYISRHIHITSETDRLANYSIKTKNLEIKGNKTHTYLLANNIPGLLEILRLKGKDIFDDWKYIKGSDTDPNPDIYKCPHYGVWANVNPVIIQTVLKNILSDDDKNLIHKGIQSLYRIIFDIFYILTPDDRENCSKMWYICNNEPTMSQIMTTAHQDDIYRLFTRLYGSEYPYFRDNDNIIFTVEKSKNEKEISILDITGNLIRTATISGNNKTSRSLGVPDSSLNRHTPGYTFGHTPGHTPGHTLGYTPVFYHR